MDIVCDNLLQSAQNSISYNGTVSYNGNAVEKKKLKKEISKYFYVIYLKDHNTNFFFQS